MAKNISDKSLNKAQVEAIEHGEGPLLIIAGAGTGKTTVIIERIKHLIILGRAKPEEILALTFTEKSSKEMEERVDIAMPLSYGDMWIMTFHSFCDRILREYAIQVGLPSNYKLMTTAQSIDLIRKNLFEFDLDYFRPLGNPNKFIEGMLQHFSRLQDETITPNEYLKFAKSYKHKDKLEIKKIKELANAFHAYDQLKIKEGMFDFGDLITCTLKLFIDRPFILKTIQLKFKYILIDEFQDTNYAQNKLAILLAGERKNITVVADDDQSIYRFRGASVSNVLQFKKNFVNAKEIVLTENYRSRQEILDASYKLIQFNNPDRLEIVSGINKKLISKCKFKNDKEPIKFIHTKNGDDEAETVIKEITKLVNKEKFEHKDIAILVRANNHADPFIRELERGGIPHQFLGPSKLFEKSEIVDLISYLKVLYNPENSEAFYRLLSANIFDIDQLELIKISSIARKTNSTIFEIAQESDNPQVKRVMGLISKHFKLIKTETAGFILYDYIKEVGLFENLIKEEDETKTKNISKFFEKIKIYENDNRNPGVVALVDYLDLLMEVGEAPTVSDGDWSSLDAVNILTAHSSKGLEFKVVFLVNLVSLRFPSTERHEQIPIPDELIKEVLPKGDFHLQEERRLFYVGMTRAKEKLYLTSADIYGDAKRVKKISPFVFEAMGDSALSNMPYAVGNKKLAANTYENTNHKTDTTMLNKVDYLSVSQIETFQVCPLHYKLKYIYKLPTEFTAPLSFGISMHCAMKEFYREVINGTKASEKLIIKKLSDNWKIEGYHNKKHRELFFEKGVNYLKKFFKTTFDPKVLPVLMEEKFNLKIANNLKISGTFDRVDKLNDSQIEIIDYKTGDKAPTQKEVDRDLQLGVYALAATKLRGEVFGKRAEEIKLSLYYFEGQQKITTTRTAKDLENLEKELLEIKNEIEKSDFKCSHHYFCLQGCEYSMFCKSGD